MRHLALLDAGLAAFMQRPPRVVLRAALLIGAFEILEGPEQAPVIIHHAVDRTREVASPAEARVANAVLRKMIGYLAAATAYPPAPGDAAGLARRYSHPQWLVERWLQAFGELDTRRLLAWDQEPARVYARRMGSHAAGAAGVQASADLVAELPAFFQPTRWRGFLLLDQPHWPDVERLLAVGRIYLQDPATALAPELLDVRPGERVLDLCAAPGGKTLLLAEAVGPEGRVVAVDLPGLRLERMRENLARYRDLRRRVSIVPADGCVLSPAILAAERQPELFDAVLIDVPCSNTGVLRHRVDAKWRVTPEDIAGLGELQRTLLARGAALVRPGGRLVYSTCSLEPEENGAVVEAFLRSPAGRAFGLKEARASRPWIDERDGAGALLLERRST